MINNEDILNTIELAQLSNKYLMDDRQDDLIEALNKITASDESSLEDKVIAFEKLGNLYWNYTRDLDKALEYMNNALELADSADISLYNILRGDIWNSKLQLLSLLGRDSEIEMELQTVISKYSEKEFKSNSYLFNAYKFKAQAEYNAGSFEAALEHLMDAQRYYPVEFYANRLHVIEISDYQGQYENLESLLSRNVCKPDDWEM